MDWTARSLYLLFTPALCSREPWATLGSALDGGVDLVQWRVATPDRDGFDRCLAACAARSVPVIVNDDVEFAAVSAAAGAHVGRSDLPLALARQRLAPGQVLGASTHDPAQLRAAIAAGADHVGVGPCHPTTTKGYTAGLPPETLRAMFAIATVPAFAIGGITAANVGRLVTLGCRRVAVSSAILRAADPAGAARAIRCQLPA